MATHNTESLYNEIVYGVIPQALPLWTSLTLYRFETNVPSATVLGIVGAGASVALSTRRSARLRKHLD